MNGRVYDPELGRFLSADPHIQNPYSSQSYNRYSYVQNNPLKYTDPSGYFSLGKIFKGIKKAVKKIGSFLKKNWRPILAIAVGALTGYATLAAYSGLGWGASWSAMMAQAGYAGAALAGATSGFASSLVSTGSIKAALRGGLYGGLSGAIAFGIGHGFGAEWGELGRALGHGIAQGGLSEAFGGDFKSGFFGAFIGHTVGARLKGMFPGRGFGMVAGRTAAAAVSGGIAAKLGGGKFENGAISAAFAHLFNSEVPEALAIRNQKLHEMGVERIRLSQKSATHIKKRHTITHPAQNKANDLFYDWFMDDTATREQIQLMVVRALDDQNPFGTFHGAKWDTIRPGFIKAYVKFPGPVGYNQPTGLGLDVIRVGLQPMGGGVYRINTVHPLSVRELFQ